HPFFAGDGFDCAAFAGAIEDAAGARDKVIALLNFPNNPTGYMTTQAENRSIADTLLRQAERGTRVIALLDDAYFGLFYHLGRESIAVRAAREPAPESARDPARRRDQGAVRLGPALRLHHLRPRARRERPGGVRGARGQGEGGRAQRRVERPPALAIPRGEGARVARFLARARREDRRAAAPRGEGLRGGERAALPRELEGLSLQQRLLHVRADRGRRGRARAPPPARRVWHRHDRDRRPRPPDRVLVPGSRRSGNAVRGAPPGGSGTSFHLTIRTQAGSVARRLPEACKSQLRSRAVRVSGEIPAPRGVTLKTLKRRETVA